MVLKANYKTDIFEGNRKYQISTDTQGRSEIVGMTTYSQEGDLFKPEDIGTIITKINHMTREVELTLLVADWSNSVPYAQTVSVPGLEETDKMQMIGAIKSTTAVATTYTWGKMRALVKVDITGNGEATFYCPKKKPTSNFNIKLVEVSMNEWYSDILWRGRS